MAGKELKGREKVVSKMTRDGLTEEKDPEKADPETDEKRADKIRKVIL